MPKSAFLESVRIEIRTKHYSIKTEKTYLYWIKQFILFNDKRHPSVMGNEEIERFLNYIAAERKVSASTQNLALCAIIFVYRHVIKQEIKHLKYDFAKQPKRLPTVLSPPEVSEILKNIHGKHHLITALLYGGGFRLNEVLSLRIKDIDLMSRSIFIFNGKGKKDRYTLLPESLIPMLKQQMEHAKHIHQKDLIEGFGSTSCPLHCIENINHHCIHLRGNIYSHRQQNVNTRMMVIFVAITSTILLILNNCALLL